MMPLVVTLLIITSVSTHGLSLDTYLHRQCDTDHQCDNGFFCYEESHLCTRCVDCASYLRKSSWRSCPKTPSDCGACLAGYEEEILHDAKTRDICILVVPNNLSHTNVPNYHNAERLVLAVPFTMLGLLLVYYVFFKKNHIRGDRSTIHRDLRCEDPPPYRSIELTTLSNNSEEQLSEEDHVMNLGQQKDHLVQAVPFQLPAYMEEELLAYDNSQADNNSDEPEYNSNERMVSTQSNIELHDENTMPSDWTPDENSNNGQLMSFELPVSSEGDDCECEPSAKRHKTDCFQPIEPDPDTNTDDTNNTHNLSINLFINNNVTIHKPY